MKQHYLLFILVAANSIHASHHPETDALTEIIKKQFSAYDADQKTEKMAQKALIKCGETRPVTILQQHNDNISSAQISWYLSNPHNFQQYIILSTLTKKPLIKAHLYHEIGHIVNNDNTPDTRKRRRWFNNGTTLASGLTFAASYAKTTKLKSRFHVATGIFGSFFTGFIERFFGQQYCKSVREERADTFAYSKLIEHNKTDVALHQIAAYLEEHQQWLNTDWSNNMAVCYLEGLDHFVNRLEVPTKRELPRYVTGYQKSLERAKIGLRIVQKNHSTSILDLIKSLPENSANRDIKQNLPTLLEQYCSELIKKS